MNPMIQKLLAIVPAPAHPENAHGKWDDVESALGLKLPDDYKEFIERYGSGVLCTYLRISSPFEFAMYEKYNGPRQGWIHFTGIYTSWLREPVNLPYPVFPEIPGLLPWGVYGDVDALAWYTEGGPDEWYIVLYRLEHGFIALKGMGFGAFLVAAVEGNLPLSADFGLQHLAQTSRKFESE
jgi:hypothetical protein